MRNTFNHCFMTTMTIIVILLLEKPSQQKVNAKSNIVNRGLLRVRKEYWFWEELNLVEKNMSMNQEKIIKFFLRINVLFVCL